MKTGFANSEDRSMIPDCLPRLIRPTTAAIAPYEYPVVLDIVEHGDDDLAANMNPMPAGNARESEGCLSFKTGSNLGVGG